MKRSSRVLATSLTTLSLFCGATSFSISSAVAQEQSDQSIRDKLTIIGNFKNNGDQIKKDNPGALVITTKDGYKEAVEVLKSNKDALRDNILIHVSDNDKIGKDTTKELVDVTKGHKVVLLTRENSDSYRALMRAKSDLSDIDVATHKNGKIDTSKDNAGSQEKISDEAGKSAKEFVDKNKAYWEAFEKRDKELDALEKELVARHEAMVNGGGGGTSGSSGSDSGSIGFVDSRSEEGRSQDPENADLNGAGNSDANWQELKQTLQKLADEKSKEIGGKVGIAVAPVSADAGISAGAAGQQVYSASTIKVPIAVAVQKNLKSDDQVQVSNVVGGTGGAISQGTYPVSKLLTEMITNSDNTATNALIEKLGGFNPVNEAISETKAEDTKLSNMMMDGANTSTITANDGVKILQEIWKSTNGKGNLLPKDKAEEIISLMKQQKHRNKLPAKVGSGITVANKTGENTGVSHDMGYFIKDDNGRSKAIAIMVTTKGNDSAAVGAVADIGAKVADWFKTM